MGCRLFFGDQHHIGKGRAQPGRDQRIGGLVRLGHRAGVAFGFNLEIRAVVDLHDAVPRLKGEAADDRNQAVKIHGRSFWRGNIALGVD